jgi:translation initiation factor eIF-2B subunit alpha
MQILIVAAEQHNKRFTVFATESRPSNTGYKAAEMLKRHGIPVNVILDSAVGYMIEKVDMVLVGAEGVVENGGLINTIGTYQLSVIAKNARKPFYAAAESFKFLRLFPLGQYDLPLYRPSTLSVLDSSRPSENGNESHPAIDYTPPEYITLLLTDLGVLTPSGVSDELIKLYYCYTDIFILHTFTAEYLRVSLEGSPVFSISAIANLQ